MPDFKEYVRRNLRLEGVAGAHETEIVEELASELEQRFEGAIALGMTPEDAWEDAKKQIPDWREFGRELRSVLRENHPAERPGSRFSNWRGDFRFAVRLLRKSPTFAWSVILVVALGIGPNTAMFSAVYSVFWAPAPWAKRGEMVVLWSRSPDGRLRLHATVDDLDRTRVHVSPRDYGEWKQHSRSFQAFGASQHTTMTMNDDSDRPERIQTELLTPGFLTMQGRKFALGRDFLPQEGTPGGHHVVVFSNAIWRQRFGADPKIIGKRVWLDGEPYTVVGVTADANRGELIWPVLAVGGDPAHQDERRLTVLALLKGGVSIGQAQAEMDVIGARLEKSLPDADAGLKVSVEPARNDWLSARTSTNLWLLMGAVSLILLIACANAASLLLARGGVRMKELAVRVSLGAWRWRIFQQLLTESLVLAGLGGAAGTALAWVILKTFLAIVPPDSVPADTAITLSLPALLFSVGTTLLAGCVFGSAPAWRATSIDVNESLKRGTGVGHTQQGHRLLKMLVVAELALTLTLLCTAGLAMRTFWHRTRLDLGLRTDHILTFEVPLRRDEPIRSFYLRLIAKIKSIPEVANAAAVNVGILSGPGTLPFAIVGNPPLADPQSAPRAAIRVATPDLFATVGARLVQGRNIDEHDLPDDPRVALVNETFARRFLADADPLRKELVLPILYPTAKFRIVGVFHDIQNAPEFGKENEPEVCVSFIQVPLRMMTLVVSSSMDPDLLRTDIATALDSLDHSLPIANVRTMQQIASGRLAFDRFEAAVYGSFAGLALLLATVGMYGVVAYFVTQRTPELGLRMALGANPAQIIQLILKQGMTLATAGLTLGIGSAWWAARLMQSTLYGAGPPNVTVMAAVGLILLVTALLASLIPARRAASVDPTSTLRGE